MPGDDTTTTTSRRIRESAEGAYEYDSHPDPTTRTLQVLSESIEGLRHVYDVRLAAMDKAITVAHEDLVRVPTEVQKAIGALKEVVMEKFQTTLEKFVTVDEKFAKVETQFSEREKALNAALLTAEKSQKNQGESFVAMTQKSEASANKEIDALKDKFTAFNRDIARIDSAIAEQSGRRAISDPAVADLATQVKNLVTLQAEQNGRRQVSDPALLELVGEVKALAKARNEESGSDTGKSDIWAKLVGAAVIGGGVIGFISFVLSHVPH